MIKERREPVDRRGGGAVHRLPPLSRHPYIKPVHQPPTEPDGAKMRERERGEEEGGGRR